MATNIPGVFAAGDVRKTNKAITTAVSDGTIAGIMAENSSIHTNRSRTGFKVKKHPISEYPQSLY